MTDEQLLERVKDLLRSNVSQGYSRLLKTDYCYIKPSSGTYPFQWWWDTCFEAFMLCALGEYDLAKRTLSSLFAMQEADGFVGHMIFWKSSLPRNPLNVLQARPTLRLLRPHMSTLIQPPMAAQAVLHVYQETQDRSFLEDMLPKLKAYQQWLITHRDFEGDGLLMLISPFESGMDWSPSFDPVVGFSGGLANWQLYWRVLSVDLRNFWHRYDLQAISKAGYFLVKGVAFNTIYTQDLLALAQLCELAGDQEEADAYRQRSHQVARRMLELMYDEESAAFYDVYGHAHRKSSVLTMATFFPTVLEAIPDEIACAVIQQHLRNEEQFTAAYPIPSVAKSEPSFFPYQTKFLWRGPTWVLANWFLYHCLRSRNFHAEADTLLLTVKRLIEQSGFREYYNPFSGVGYGAKQFTWSGLVVDLLRMKTSAGG